MKTNRFRWALAAACVTLALLLCTTCIRAGAHEYQWDDFDAKDDLSNELKIVVYDGRQKGFYLRQRHFDLNDVRLLAECVYAAKFVNEGQAKRLVNVVCDLVSEHQAERIRHNTFLTDRVKTNNKNVLNNISVIWPLLFVM